MRTTYRVLAYLVALGVFAQAATIAFAWFSVINEVEGGAVFDGEGSANAGHALHGIVGMNVLPLLALLLLISAFFAKVQGGVTWAAFVLLAVVAQVVLGIVAFSFPAVGALHGINALVILGLALTAGHRTGERHTSTESAPRAAERPTGQPPTAAGV